MMILFIRVPALTGEDEVRLAPPPGFQVRNRIRLAPGQFTGGLLALPGGDLVIYNGSSVVRHPREPGREPEVLLTPAEPPVFGSFLRLRPDGRSILFGETRTGGGLHGIWRLPLEPMGIPAERVDVLRFNFDLAFDDVGRGFISAYASGTDNRIYLLDEEPDRPNAEVVKGIPGGSGPVAFHDRRLYCATAVLEKGVNRIFYVTSAQIEAAIASREALHFETDIPREQVVAGGLDTYFNLAFAGELLLASESVGRRIDRILPGRAESFAEVLVEGAGIGGATYLCFVPGPKPFQGGAGLEGGTLYANVADYITFNDIVEVIPEVHFRRGAINGDAEIDLSDSIALLGHLFLGGASPIPLAAGDVNDDSELDLSDALYLLAYLFLGGPSPPEPFEAQGPDPTQ